jgi:hypothetical protein
MSFISFGSDEKAPFVLVNFADLAVCPLNRIGGIDNLANLMIVLQECREVHPVVQPGPAAQGYFLPHFSSNSSSLS